MLSKILYAEKEGNQPFLIAGSGTMGWDQVGANLLEQGDEAVSCRLLLQLPRSLLRILGCSELRILWSSVCRLVSSHMQISEQS